MQAKKAEADFKEAKQKWFEHSHVQSVRTLGCTSNTCTQVVPSDEGFLGLCRSSKEELELTDDDVKTLHANGIRKDSDFTDLREGPY